MPSAVSASLDARVDGEPAADDSFLVRLRAETRAEHAATERRIAPATRLQDVGSYIRLLRSFSPLYAFVEMRLGLFTEWSDLEPPIDIRFRLRAHLLAADLCILGVEPACTDAVALPQIDRFAEAFGALYVLEGSRLGGIILARHVTTAIGPAAEGALRFLDSGGPGAVGRLWLEFRAALSAYAAHASPQTLDAIVAGAVDTFRCFDRQLERWDA